MRINGETLKRLRKKRGFSQETLAEASRVSKKTIARIETGKKGEPRGSTAQLLAKALGVKDVEALAREPNKLGVVRGAEFGKRGKRHFLDSKTLLAYDLVEEKYGFADYGLSATKSLIEAAPFLFTLLAEMSLADRRRRAEEARAAFAAANRVLPEYLDGRDWEDVFSAEEASIKERDLFYSRGDENRLSYFEQEHRNPFFDFLIRLADELGPDNEAIDGGYISDIYVNAVDSVDVGDFTTSTKGLFHKYLERLGGGSERADHALARGYARIGEIPKEFLGEDEDTVAKRVKWLEAKVPDKDWAENERFQKQLKEMMEKHWEETRQTFRESEAGKPSDNLVEFPQKGALDDV